MPTSPSRQRRKRSATIPLSLERQPSLLDLVAPTGIQAKFRKFHQENPHVYERLKTLVLDDVRTGREIPGIDYYVNVLRWKIRMETHGDDFKFNNNFRSRYARLLMESEPEIAGKFEIRSLLSA